MSVRKLSQNRINEMGVKIHKKAKVNQALENQTTMD